jgi:Tfp pilus assembly protein PilF
VAQPATNHIDRRLDSWKEIAAFFGRDERTVRRWEKENALPVHRVPGGAKGRVFAYESELRQWLDTPQAQAPIAAASGLPVGPEQSEAQGSVDNGRWNPRRAGKWAAAIAVCGLLAVGLLVYRKHHRFAAYASAARPSQAEEFYLKGRYYWSRRTPDDLNKALDYFMQAVVQDPGYAKAYVGLADCYNLMREYTLMPSNEAYTRAFAAAKKAVELDDRSSEAHASLAFASFFGMWDLTSGEREFRRAIELNPSNATAHHWYANALSALDRPGDALAEIDRAQALDPSSSAILADRANILASNGRQEEGTRLLKQLEEREPAFRSPHLYLIGIYLRNRDYPNFISELRWDARSTHNNAELEIADDAEKGLAAGGRDGMMKAVMQIKERLYAQRQLSPFDLAQTYAMAGNKAQAIKYLNEAYAQRDGSLLFVRTSVEFAGLHDEPGYRDLVARMNFPTNFPH